MNGTYHNLTIVMISSFYVDHMTKLEARSATGMTGMGYDYIRSKKLLKGQKFCERTENL